MIAVALAVALVVVAVLTGLLAAADRDRRAAQADADALRAELARYRTAHACLTPDADLADDLAAIETYANTHREEGR